MRQAHILREDGETAGAYDFDAIKIISTSRLTIFSQNMSLPHIHL
jgi:hypothetical protein